jgi:glycosyltransferase involved in cell wall biosynthesis
MLFSVVTPVLNGMAFLPGCIHSVRAQQCEGVEVEHVVLDGGSTDGSGEFAQAQGCRVLVREKQGLTFAINKGFNNACGDFVSMLGCDDRLLPGGLARVGETYAREGLPWIVSSCRWLDASGASLGSQPAAPRWITAGILSCLGWNCIPQVSSFMRPELHRRLGDLDERFTYASDYELACRALSSGQRFSRVAKSVVAMMRHGSNLSMQERPEHLAELEEVRRRYGPSSAVKGKLNRYALKIWLNAANPDWFLQKRR